MEWMNGWLVVYWSRSVLDVRYQKVYNKQGDNGSYILIALLIMNVIIMLMELRFIYLQFTL